VSLAKIQPGVNTFDICDIQKAETQGALTRRFGM